MTKKPSPLQAARTRVAAELQLPEDDWRTVRLAALVVAYDGVQATLATGNPRDADIDALLKLDQQIAEVRKEAGLSKPMTLDVHIVESLDMQTCPSCQHRFDLATARRTLEEARHAARERDAAEMARQEAVPQRQGTVSAPAKNDAPAGSPTPSNVVAIDGEKRAADLRAAARVTGGIDPGPVRPYVGGGDIYSGDSPSALMRRIERDYR